MHGETVKFNQYQISWKSVHWEPSFSLRTEGQKYKAKLTVAFRNFSKGPTHLIQGTRWTDQKHDQASSQNSPLVNIQNSFASSSHGHDKNPVKNCQHRCTVSW